jgi:hypothetical protein
MVRRWIIRSFFIGLCVVCVGVWVGSYFQEAWLEHIGPTGNALFRIFPGSLDFDCLRSSHFSGDQWDWNHGPSRMTFFQWYYHSMDHHFLGFAYQRQVDPRRYRAVFVPLWFATALSGLLLWFAWRKTRPKVQGNAFPVEPAGAKAIQ